MSVKYHTFSNDLKAKDLHYTDKFFELKGQRIIPSDSFSFSSYEALRNVNDFKTNNLSNLFLINKQQNHNWLKARVKQADKLNGIATTISWYSPNLENEDQLGSWLYFAKNYEMFDMNVSQVDCMITYGRPQKNYSNYIFYLEFLDQNTCRISHTFGDLIFYLVVEEDKTVKFSKNINGQRQVFIYNLDGGLLKLYKKVKHSIYDERDQVKQTYNKLYLMSISRNAQTSQTTFVLNQNLQDQSYDSLIYVNNNELMFDFYLDGSWVSYDRSKYMSSIDRQRSAFELNTQALLHHEYNTDQGINFIPLKTNLTYKGNSIRGNNTNESTLNYPDVDFRTYNTIQSGTNQEKGTENIILTFTFVDQEYDVHQGDDLYFTIPQKSLEGTNMLQPLWPYKYINLNDTKFIKNGAFGSNVPYFADKVKRLQNYKSTITDKNGKKLSPNNETYLCSWLYKASNQSQPMWLDRYYYPDMISRQEALRLPSLKKSFENIIDVNYRDGAIRKQIHELTYFDKKSDLMIEAGNTYRYQRVSNDTIKEINENLDNHLIKKGTNQSKKEIDLYDVIQFNNETFRKISYKDLNRTNAINFNADFYLERDKRIGIQLFGTDYSNGFNIQNRKDLAPFHYYATDEVLYLLNNKFEVVHQFDLYTKYEDYILKLFLGDMFDDVVILSGIYMYILTYDLRLKSRIDMTAMGVSGSDDSQSEDVEVINSIKNIQNIVLSEYEDISLVNYPYGNVGLEVESFVDSGSFEYDYDYDDDYIEYQQKFIGSTYISVSYNTIDTGYINIPSNLCQVMSKSKAIMYHNNLYVPLNQDIMKIIMCPDCDIDFEQFTEKDRQNYPAAARLLHSSQYYLNYLKTGSGTGDTEKLGVEQGFIQVQNIIKHIHIDKDGNIYGLNFDTYGVAADGDTLYGLYGLENYVYSGGWWWLFNQSLSKMKSDAITSKYAEFASPNSIDMVKLNELGQMCLVRNFHNLLDNNDPDNYKRFEIYDKTKALIYTYNLESFEEVLTLDAYNFIDQAHEQQTCFTMLCSAADSIYKITYFSNSKSISTQRINVPSNICKNFIETTNTNALLRYNDYNVLYFNLHIPSNYIYDYVATIKWDLSDIQNGWYNINVLVDLDAGEFAIRINDKLYEVVNQTSHSWFKPYQSSNGNIFSTNYYVGVLGKKYGTTMNGLLKNSPYDPYACRNCSIDRMRIYTRRLNYYEYLAMRLEQSGVNKLILTLPCGNRSNIDEMVRFFKYNASPSITNKVKINISGTGLETSGEFDMLRKEIMAVLENNTDCLMTIKEIEFIQNE